MKTRSDFFLEEDYYAYKAVERMKTFIETCNTLTEKQTAAMLSLLADLERKCYSAGHANAEFEENGEGC